MPRLRKIFVVVPVLVFLLVLQNRLLAKEWLPLYLNIKRMKWEILLPINPPFVLVSVVYSEIY